MAKDKMNNLVSYTDFVNNWKKSCEIILNK